MVKLNLEYLLRRDNRTRYWLVKELESSYPVVNKLIDNEVKSIRFETIDKLCKIFDCTFNDLFIKK